MKQFRKVRVTRLRQVWRYRIMNPPSAIALRMRKIHGVNKAFAAYV
ncbi:MAG: hypothetical protein LBS79_05760 [Tannerella sp.]|nr:hypothetical protein [Tannerella sp.]